MATKDLLRSPHVFRKDDVWWYETGDGIEIIVDPNAEIRHIKIKWSSLRAALKRKDKRSNDGH